MMKKIFGLALVGVSSLLLASCSDEISINNYSNATLDVKKFVPDTFEAGYRAETSTSKAISNVESGDTLKTESFDKITSGAAEVQEYADMFMDIFELYKSFLVEDKMYEYTAAGTTSYLLLESVDGEYDGSDVTGHRVNFFTEYSTGIKQSGMINFYNYTNGEILFDAYYKEVSDVYETTLRLQYSDTLLRFYLQSETNSLDINIAREYQSNDDVSTMSEYGYVDFANSGITEYYLTASGDDEYGFLTANASTTVFGGSMEFQATEVYKNINDGEDAQFSYMISNMTVGSTKIARGVYPLQSVSGWTTYTGIEGIDSYGEVDEWSLTTTNSVIDENTSPLFDMYYAESYDRSRGSTEIERKERDIASICIYAQPGNTSVYNIKNISSDLSQSIDSTKLNELVEDSESFHTTAKFNNESLLDLDKSDISENLSNVENNEMSNFYNELDDYLNN